MNVQDEQNRPADGQLAAHCFRHDWTCTGCPADTPWPCEPAKASLRIRLDPVDLREYLFQCWRRAVVDLGVFDDPDRGALYVRIVGWTDT